MSDQIYGPIIFIGRETELALFEQMLDRPSDRWILNIYGDGGLGKTKLLEQMRLVVQKRAQGQEKIFFTREFLDFYWTTNQRELGILKSLADQLRSAGEFDSFYQSLDEYDKLITQKESPNPEQVRYKRDEVSERFLTGYRILTGRRRVILFFDTAEQAGEAIEHFWRDLLPRLRGNTLIVASGRKKIKLLPEDQTVFYVIKGFTGQETSQYFQARGLDIPVPITCRICELAKTRPVLIALAADWIIHGHAAEEIVQHSEDKFEGAMVEQIRGLQPAEETLAILAMAHLYRRFDEEVLARVLEQPLDQCTTLISRLSSLSFIKYRPPVAGRRGSCLLHDEVRALIDLHVWPSFDPRTDYRLTWSQKVIGYYIWRIGTEQDPLERQNLNLERLFYTFDVNPTEGFVLSRELFKTAIDHLDADYMEAINAEVNRWKKALSPQMLREVTFREAVVFHRREQYDRAIEAMERVALDGESELLLKAEALARLVEYCADGGHPAQAIEYGKTGEQVCRQLSGRYPAREIAQIQGLLQNNMGFAHRQQGDLEQAIELYKRALAEYQKAGGPPSMIARIRNNLGFAYSRIGQADQAESQCKIALKDRLRLDIPYELGLSYNVLGSVYADALRANEAIENFKRAEMEFQRAGSERGRALVNIAYGRLMRQWGWYREQFAKEPFNPNREEYTQAGMLLKQAVEILGKVKDRANLLEALNELGCLNRQRLEWEQAEYYFQQSKDLAEAIGNLVRVADNLQDMSLLYYQQGNTDMAASFAHRASQAALQTGSYYLHGKAQRMLSDLAFAAGDYDDAFQALALACIYVLKHRPVSQVGQEPARTKLYYQEMVGVAEEKILALPDHESARKYCDYLVDEWISAGLSGAYPGFVERIRCLSQDYPFLKKVEE